VFLLLLGLGVCDGTLNDSQTALFARGAGVVGQILDVGPSNMHPKYASETSEPGPPRRPRSSTSHLKRIMEVVPVAILVSDRDALGSGQSFISCWCCGVALAMGGRRECFLLLSHGVLFWFNVPSVSGVPIFRARRVSRSLFLGDRIFQS